MVSFVSCVDQSRSSRPDPSWAMHVLLQEVKSSWKGVQSRLKKWRPEPERLLETLPATFDELPEVIKGNMGWSDRQRAKPDQCLRRRWRHTHASQVRLRNTNANHAQNPRQMAAVSSQSMMGAVGNVAMQLLQLQQLQAASVAALPNLQVFTENLRGGTGHHSQTPPSRAEAPAQSPQSKRPLKALMDSPWNESKQERQKMSDNKAPAPAQEERAKEDASTDRLRAKREEKGPSEPQTTVPGGDSAVDPARRTCAVMQRPAASPATKVCKPAKKPASAVPEAKKPNLSFDAKRWGSCRAEYSREKSYIRCWDSRDAKWRMIIGSTSADGKHVEICEKLVPYVKQGKDRDELQRLRAKLE
ncbi:unnamed protein product [Durusdinium trenchii]|uniref:Uncharacterized protein n=1 Tax=Durusdinium trenchii TaxID=1381693 RepID=A0ABP0PRR6_9DINO